MWNANLYNKFSKERIQPSKDLAQRIMVADCKRVIDIGCGSGMSTFCIKERFIKNAGKLLNKEGGTCDTGS